MPRKEIDYSKTLMYKIVCNDINVTDMYVGHTTDFTRRKSEHKSVCNNPNSKYHNYNVYQFIRANGGWDNWEIVLIEYYPCNDSLEATQRERYWKEELGANLNTQTPSRTRKQYYQENKELIWKQQKQYNQANKEAIAKMQKQYCENHKDKKSEYDKQYRQLNKEKIKATKSKSYVCDCGRHYTYSHKQSHLRTQTHQHYEQNKLFYTINKGLNIIKALDKHFPNSC